MYRKTPAVGSLFLIKLQAIRPTTLLKREPNRCFPVNITKFLRTVFFIEHLPWAAFGKSFDILNGGVLGLCQTPMMELLVKIVDSY